MKLRIIGMLLLASTLLATDLPTQKARTEKEKIEALILAVENLKEARFYRNGSYHSAKDAAAHLRMKWEKAGSKIKTATDFIDKLASKSSVTGQEYKIFYTNGRAITASSFFYAELKKINAQP